MATIEQILSEAREKDKKLQIATKKQLPMANINKPMVEPNTFTPYTNEEIGRLQHATRIPIRGSLTGMEDKVRQNTEYALNEFPGMYGFMEGFNPMSPKRQLERSIGQPIDTSEAEDSIAYKVGYGAGLMGQYAVTGGVAHGAVRGGITKAIPKLAQNATRTQRVLGTMGASALADTLTGVPINTVQAIKESSVNDKVDWNKFAKSFAINTAIDVVFGGLIEGGIALKSGKKVKTVGDLTNLTKAEAEEFTQKLLPAPEKVALLNEPQKQLPEPVFYADEMGRIDIDPNLSSSKNVITEEPYVQNELEVMIERPGGGLESTGKEFDFGWSNDDVNLVNQFIGLTQKQGVPPKTYLKAITNRLDNEYNEILKTVEDYHINYKPQGVELVPIFNELGDTQRKIRSSKNEQWYSDWWKSRKKAPTKQDKIAIAKKRLDEEIRTAQYGKSSEFVDPKFAAEYNLIYRLNEIFDKLPDDTLGVYLRDYDNMAAIIGKETTIVKPDYTKKPLMDRIETPKRVFPGELDNGVIPNKTLSGKVSKQSVKSEPIILGEPKVETPIKLDEPTVETSVMEKSIPVKVDEPKVQPVKPSKSIKDLPEDVQKAYTTFEANEGGFAGQPAEGFGLGELSVNVKNAHVRKSNSLSLNADYALGKNTPEREIFKEQIEKPFAESKRVYVDRIKEEAKSLKENIVDKLGISKGSRESAGVQWLGEGKKVVKVGKTYQEVDYNISDLMNEFDYIAPNGKKAWENIVEADKYFRIKYNEYVDRINEVLKKIYPNVEETVSKIDTRIAKETDPKKIEQLNWAKHKATQNKRLYPRQDYYRHFKELDDSFLSTIDGVRRSATDIGPDLIGKTEFTKPNSKWAGILQQRLGWLGYKPDAVGGMIDYMQQAEYKINVEPNIKNVRGFIKDLVINTDTTKNANSFIEALQDFTNELAGKTNTIDRAVQNMLGDRTGRVVLNATMQIMNRLKANAVMGNIGTVFVQPFNLPNVVSYAKDPVAVADGMFKALQGLAGNKEVKAILNKSTFLQERYLSRAYRQFDEGLFKKTENFTAWTLEALDKAVAESAFITFYKQNIKKGMQEADAIFEADELVKRSIGGRGIGEMPPSQKAKLSKILVPFTVEVRNALNVYKGHVFDLTKGAKTGNAKLTGNAALALTELVTVGYLLNRMGEAVLNRESILPDPIDAILSELQDEEPSITDAMLRLLGEGLSAHPAGQYIAGIGAEGLGLTEYDMKELFGESDPTRYGTGPMLISTLGEPIGQVLRGQNVDVLGPALSFLPKFGGRQIERSIRGLQDMAVLPKETINKEGVSVKTQDFPASYSAGGNMRFTIDKTPSNYIRAGTTGTWSTKEAKNYIEQGNKPLGDKQEEAVVKLGGLPKVEKFVREFPKTGVEQQRKLIMDSDYKDHEKAILDRTLINSPVKPDYSSKDNYEFSLLTSATKQKYIGLANKGITKRMFMDAVSNADADGNGYNNKDEAKAYLDKQEYLTRKQKAELWKVLSTAKNPYE